MASNAFGSTFLEDISTPPSSTNRALFNETDKDTQSTGGFLTFISIMTITTIYTKKYMDINVYSFPHRLDVMIWNMNYLGKRGLISNRALSWNV